MTRFVLLLPIVLQMGFTRRLVAQDSLSDSLSDSLRRSSRLEGGWLRRLPIDDARHGLALLPGVRLTGTDIGITPFAALSIRGSSTARGNVYVDGASLRFQTRGGAGVGLAPGEIENVAVLTGAAPAWLGDAAGGALAYETAAGGERLAARARLGGDVGGVSSAGYGQFDVSLGGPFKAGSRLTFIVTAAAQSQDASYRGPAASRIPSFLPVGVDTVADTGSAQVAVPLWDQVNSRPLDWSSVRQGHAKLQYRYGRASRVALTLLAGELEQRTFPGQLALDPALYTGRRLTSDAIILVWQHDLGAWRGGSLTADLNVSHVNHRDIAGPLDSTVQLATAESGFCFPLECLPPPPQLRFAGADILDLPASNQLVRDLRSNSGTRGVPFFGTRPDVTQRGRLNPYGLAQGWPTDGYGGTLTDVAERRWQGRWAMSWQRSAQRVTAGIDLERTHGSSYASDIVRQVGTDIFTADPRRLGVFSEARLPIADAILSVGLRFDRITPGGEQPILPAFISSSGSAYWNPNAATDDTAYANSVARVFRRARTQSVFSPRLELSYPFAPRAAAHLAYSRTVEPPSWSNFFSRSNSDLSFTSFADLFGRDIDFAVVGLAEGGVRFAPGRATVDVSVYRQNAPIYVGRLRQITDPRDSSKVVTVNALTLLDESYTQGVDVGVQWQRGWLTMSGAYGLSHTTGSPGSNRAPVTTHSAAMAAWLRVPSDWRSGGVLGSVARGVDVILLGRVQSGEPYTRLQNTGLGTIAPGAGSGSVPIEPSNASRLPGYKRVDLRIAKTLRIWRHDWSLYVDARNVINLSNLTSLFAETGGTTNDLHRAATIGDPALNTGEFGILRNEAANAGALQLDGTTVDLSSCATWPSQVNCVALMRVEQRFGNGDRLFTLAEQQDAFGAYYRDFFGAWRFYAPGRAVRIGLEFEL